MPSYSNGYIPLDLLVVFKTGWNSTDGDWYHALPPASYARHLALVDLAHQRTGRTLEISDGFGAYRPIESQHLARRLYGNGAAFPGTSSHGGFWEGQQTAAMDYSNWAWVYGGDFAAFAADCAAVGLWAGAIMPDRGYPEEKWHVVDLDPWSAVPAFASSTPFPSTRPKEYPDMKLIKKVTPEGVFYALTGNRFFQTLSEAQYFNLTPVWGEAVNLTYAQWDECLNMASL